METPSGDGWSALHGQTDFRHHPALHADLPRGQVCRLAEVSDCREILEHPVWKQLAPVTICRSPFDPLPGELKKLNIYIEPVEVCPTIRPQIQMETQVRILVPLFPVYITPGHSFGGYINGNQGV